MATSGKPNQLFPGLALLAVLILVPGSWRLTGPILSGQEQVAAPERRVPERSALDEAPPEVLALLSEVLTRMPPAGSGVAESQFFHWSTPGAPTQAALGIKAVPGVDPDALIRRVMEVDGYEGRIAHVLANQSRSIPAEEVPDRVTFAQRINVPGITTVQHELELVDAGTIEGYRVAYWFLLDEETAALDPSQGARSESNVGIWLAGPGVVGYAFHSWPKREDVNRIQWFSLTTGATVAASRIVERNIDDMAEWARQ
ncbi:hypothetical protein [Tautonia rosea]|uniref:hypothetical protein n=1 Tax=Tautonia rosea TaxID=2728037 RepID=UPI001474BF5C|nr:hypothetical protein [Tautonia rosea]